MSSSDCPYPNFCFALSYNKVAVSHTLSSLDAREPRVAATGAETALYKSVSNRISKPTHFSLLYIQTLTSIWTEHLMSKGISHYSLTTLDILCRILTDDVIFCRMLTDDVIFCWILSDDVRKF